jgi:ABC-type phosphate transport system auxiliary subunit
VNPYLNAVGLDTSWFILNMGSPWLFLALAVVGVALLPILTLLSNKTGLLKN